ncbi:MAG: hypothetical protein ACI9YU_001205 [Flavobacteriales bacterium]|jgi:hypothetical protein
MRFVGIILILLCSAICGAQENLVPDPSFEENVNCPFLGGQLWMLPEWDLVRGGGSVDYYHSCAQDCCNWYGNRNGSQEPRTGNGYINILLQHNNHTFPGTIEGNFIGNGLTDTLKAGHRYDVELFVSLIDSGRYACRNIGVHFSDGQPIDDVDTLLILEPQVGYEGPFLTDKENWVEISGSFIAEGGENYLTIGNFDGAENSDTLNLNEGGTDPTTDYWEIAAYFLDDVSVVEDTSYHVGVGPFGSAQGPSVKLWPNPVQEALRIEVKPRVKHGVTVVDIMGREILRCALNDGSVDVSGLENGVYFINIQFEDGREVSRKFVKE